VAWVGPSFKKKTVSVSLGIIRKLEERGLSHLCRSLPVQCWNCKAPDGSWGQASASQSQEAWRSTNTTSRPGEAEPRSWRTRLGCTGPWRELAQRLRRHWTL